MWRQVLPVVSRPYVYRPLLEKNHSPQACAQWAWTWPDQPWTPHCSIICGTLYNFHKLEPQTCEPRIMLHLQGFNQDQTDGCKASSEVFTGAQNTAVGTNQLPSAEPCLCRQALVKSHSSVAMKEGWEHAIKDCCSVPALR